jgi:hypothetical protein
MSALPRLLAMVAVSALLAGCGGYSGFNNSANWGQQRSYYNGTTGYGYTNSRPNNNNTGGMRYYPNANCWECGRS